jgi:hypothetical protein
MSGGWVVSFLAQLNPFAHSSLAFNLGHERAKLADIQVPDE